ncbi:ectoine utilization protein EutA [Azospirillum sp. A39]|uniref:ectoine utilization protein EutA n=1 Tax=Azospirillum sp. A39 TaxID=3462279 RepID=UPI004046125E
MTLPVIRRACAPFVLDDRPQRRRIGLVVLATDHTTEPDFARLVAPRGIAVHTARVAYANPTTAENLRRLEPRLAEAAALLLPDEELDALCFSCTSASVVIGDAAVAAAIHAAKPGVPVVTPTAAARRALTALGARRIALLTPYTEETTAPVARHFANHGFALAAVTALGLSDDRAMARIAPRHIVEAAREAMPDDAEALFVSCTALRAAAAVPAIEAALGRPVVTSNLATAWSCLRRCGDTAPQPHLGRLMALPPDGEGTR